VYENHQAFPHYLVTYSAGPRQNPYGGGLRLHKIDGAPDTLKTPVTVRTGGVASFLSPELLEAWRRRREANAAARRAGYGGNGGAQQGPAQQQQGNKVTQTCCRSSKAKAKAAAATVLAVLLLVAAIAILTPSSSCNTESCWRYGALGEACSATCSSAGMGCEEGDWGVHGEQSMRAALEAAGQSADALCTGGFHSSSMESSPKVWESGGYCLYMPGSGSTSCSAAGSYNRRLCRCV
jgi:hypothetical protein